MEVYSPGGFKYVTVDKSDKNKTQKVEMGLSEQSKPKIIVSGGSFGFESGAWRHNSYLSG